MQYKVFKIKLKGHQEYLSSLFLEAKWYYNWLLSHDDMKAVDTKLTLIPVKRGEEFGKEDLGKLSAQMRQSMYQRVWDNVRGLSVRKNNGGRVGRLKFVRELNSIPLNNQTFSVLGNKVKLQKLKAPIKFVGGKQLPENMDVRKADLVRKPSGFYLHICVRMKEMVNPLPQDVLGLDMGIADALVFSDGTKVNYSADTTKLRQLSKSLSRKTKGSSRWYKTKHQLAREHERHVNRKNDASNKINNALRNHIVVFQDEMISGWQKGLFGKQVHRSILGRLKSALQTNPNNLMLSRSLPTTQLCPSCGSLNKHPLKERVYSCECGYSCDRDTHAAKNMLAFSGQELACVEKGSDVFQILSGIQNAHLSVKREAMPFRA